jgi:hypothetical protein
LATARALDGISCGKVASAEKLSRKWLLHDFCLQNLCKVLMRRPHWNVPKRGLLPIPSPSVLAQLAALKGLPTPDLKRRWRDS